MQPITAPILSTHRPIGTGGFMDPDLIAAGFGIKKGMNLADFGCGAGYFTISLANETGPGGKVYALDVQESALDNVRAKARSHGLENVETIRANLEIIGSSGLIDSSQDIVLLANILFQSVKKAEIIREAKRVLRGGGKMIIIDWKKGVGGFGPPEDLKSDCEEMRKLGEKEGLSFEHNIDAGQFHFGIMFHKP